MLKRNPKLLNLPVQRSLSHSEHLSGFAAVAGDFAQGGRDRILLELLQCHPGFEDDDFVLGFEVFFGGLDILDVGRWRRIGGQWIAGESGRQLDMGAPVLVELMAQVLDVHAELKQRAEYELERGRRAGGFNEKRALQ